MIKKISDVLVNTKYFIALSEDSENVKKGKILEIKKYEFNSMDLELRIEFDTQSLLKLSEIGIGKTKASAKKNYSKIINNTY